MSSDQALPSFWLSEYHSSGDVYAHGVFKVLAYKQTSFQEMFIVDSGPYGKSLVLDGHWQSSVGDEFLYHETLVHPALILHPDPKNVLILGGAEGATVREVLRWHSVERVVMVDIDGDVVQACREHLPEMHQNAFEDPRVELRIEDALDFLGNTTEQWDVIISDLTDPIESGPAYKLFTQEFFQTIRQVLSPQGNYVLQAGSIAPIEIEVHARTIKTLGSVFNHVRSYCTSTPTYGVPLGLGLASLQPIPWYVDPDVIDQKLQEETHGGFQLMDGVTLLGLLQTPGHVRRAIEAETLIYTLTNPPTLKDPMSM